MSLKHCSESSSILCSYKSCIANSNEPVRYSAEDPERHSKLLSLRMTLYDRYLKHCSECLSSILRHSLVVQLLVGSSILRHTNTAK